MNICVVCSGNICRSPFCEQILKRELNGKYTIYSAGLLEIFGSPAYDPCVKLAPLYKVNLSSHSSQGMTPIIAEKTNIFLVMTKRHNVLLQRDFNIAYNKILLLSTFLPNDKIIDLGILGTTQRGADIPDPMGQRIEVVRPVFDVLNIACIGFSKWIQSH